jgi:mannose/cellobiose epimerase-like protein (N-acyl-D-glucosamine 2-epimerase family)
LSANDLQVQAREARRWLFEEAFPLWSTAGFDAPSGQFVEQLAPSGEPVVDLPRRTLVQARQIYVFSRAGLMGWNGPWRAVVTAAAGVLMARGRSVAGDWIYSFDASGGQLDSRRDLYTQAFVIFGLAHAAMALERPDLLAAASETRERLDHHWRAPTGGFLEGELYSGVRRQNPHMHLFEAAMALQAAGGADGGLADELADLFKARFLTEGGLVEYYDGNLVPLTDERGRITEPGHMFEWAWLIGRWAEINGTGEAAVIDQLLDGARRGVTAEGYAQDEIWSDGSVRVASARLWPQCERLKAVLAKLERTGEAAEVLAAWSALNSYLAAAPAGSWRDRRAADGRQNPGPAPASSGYHLVSALEELIRIAAPGDRG